MRVGHRVLSRDGYVDYGPDICGRGTIVRTQPSGLVRVLWDNTDDLTWEDIGDLLPLDHFTRER